MKKILCMLLSGVFLFASINLNTASKSELMSINGIGAKKAEQILEFRKTNKITQAQDLRSIKGFGPTLVKKIEKLLQKN